MTSNTWTKWLGFPGGAVIGLLGAFYSRYTAKSAVKVRPKLAEVGYIDAMMTNHGHDWLFYHYPNIMTVAIVVLFALITGFGWWSMD